MNPDALARALDYCGNAEDDEALMAIDDALAAATTLATIKELWRRTDQEHVEDYLTACDFLQEVSDLLAPTSAERLKSCGQDLHDALDDLAGDLFGPAMTPPLLALSRLTIDRAYTCAPRAMHVQDTCETHAHTCPATVPYRTVPYRTVPYLALPPLYLPPPGRSPQRRGEIMLKQTIGERIAALEERVAILERGQAATSAGAPDVWLTATDAARALGVHDRTLKRWANEGRIPAGDAHRDLMSGFWLFRQSWVLSQPVVKR